MTKKVAYMSSTLRICHESQRSAPSPRLVETISTATTTISAKPRPSRRPVKMDGSDPGRSTAVKRRQPRAP